MLVSVYVAAALEIFVAAGKLSVSACGSQFPDQGWNKGPLLWEHRVLATGPRGKSRQFGR